MTFLIMNQLDDDERQNSDDDSADEDGSQI